MGVTPPRRRGGRLAWGVADQGLSSATNFAVGILVARSVSAVDFGAFALVFALYSIAVSLSRAVATEPFLVRFSAGEPSTVLVEARRATGTALALGVVGAALGLTTSLVMPAEIAPVLRSLSVCLPALLLQDAWRQVAFGTGHESRAFTNDLVWLLAMAPMFAIALSGGTTSATLVLMWGLAAAVAAVFGAWQVRSLPSPASVVQWLRAHRDLWPRFAGESILIAGAPQLYSIAIAAFAGLVAAGQIRLVLIVLGPVHVLIQGVGLVAIPEAVRSLARGRRHLTSTALLISGVIAGGALAWGLLVALTPREWWVFLAGDGWLAASAILVPLSVHQILNGANTGAHVGLRAMQAARRSLRTRLITSSLLVLAPTAAVVVGGGITAAAWALAGVALVNLCLWWARYATTPGSAPLSPSGTS